MDINKLAQLNSKYFNENKVSNKKIYTSYVNIKKAFPENYKIYTPGIAIKYRSSFKTLLKLTNDKTKTKFIIYNKVCKWYANEEIINLSMEKIFIKTKLGSYSSGGCGIGASLFAGLTASGVFSYMDIYVKRLGPLFFSLYAILVLIFGVKVLSNEDNKVEMYNMFLEVINNLEYDKNDKLG